MSPALVHLDEYLGQAFHRMPVAMIVVDQQGIISRANGLAESTFGYDSGELLGLSVEALVPDRFRAHHPQFRQGFTAETHARPMGAGRDLSGRRKNGSEFPVEIGINPVVTGEGPMVLSVIVDLTERKLAEQRIKDALRQKDLLLREVHHRVKNNLQVVHSLLDLQAMKVKDPEVISALRDSQNRVRSMSLIHQTLYQSTNVAQVDFNQFLSELMVGLTEAYRSATGRVDIHVQAKDVRLPINEAIPCGLIINELVSNALKHGFADGRSGAIWITLEREGKQVMVQVANDGATIPEGHDLRRTGSLGLQLVNLFTRQLRGKLDVQRANPVSFTIRFDLEETA